MNGKYYPKDARRVKEQEFLSLKQGNMNAVEYTAKFNEHSHFLPNEVATKEMKIDHFEQGLKGSIRSMVTGHPVDSYQEMY